MPTIVNDLRYALRQLRKSPGFTATAILSLALGIGATTAVFSVVHAILMDPFPYANSDRMIHLRLVNAAGQEQGFGLTAAHWQELRKSPVVEDTFAAGGWNLTITGKDLPEDVSADYFSSNAFNYFGVPAALGRGILPSDAVDGQDPQPVAVLSYKFWQRHYSSDPAALGQTLQLLHKNYTIVGVAAPRFMWDDADVYLPLKITQDQVLTYYCGVRLKPGVTHEMADAALQPLMEQFAKETPNHFPHDKFRMRVVGLNADFIKQLGGTLSLLFCAVALLLVIGCGNVSILLLARGTGRRQEFAVRSAIGASRGRMIRQLLTESLLLSLTGAALGVGLAYVSLAKIVAALPQYSFPHEAAIRINVPVLVFCVGVAVFTGVLFGLWPALQLSRPEVSQMMQGSSRKVAGSVHGRRTLNLLIGGQIALTLLMLAGAGAALEGFVRLMHTDLGYDPHNIMSVGIPVHDGTYKTWEERSNYFEQLRAKVATVPGVRIAAISTNATPPANGNDTKFEILGRPGAVDQNGRVNFVSPGYFPALRIPMAEGRIWDETENRNGQAVIVINQTLARKYFPKGDALGHSIKVPELKNQPPYNLIAPGADGWLRIIGIIVDKRDDGLRNPILPEAFVPYTLAMHMYTQILVRSDVSPLTLLHSVRTQVNAVDHDQQTNGNVQDLEHWIMTQPEYAQEQFISWLFGAFALLALALAAVGLYSVVSYSVAQRTNEFGIRMALGAQRGHVLNIVFASTVASVAGGVAAGVVLSLALNKVVAQWAEGSSRDPLMLVGVTLVLTAVAAVACAVPARRASKVDPMTALRYE
ncbi:ABC transporter permease [Acidicapsa ligni]|uniref:ABC transporter permease n=1 Tax=Acidicapsa ligni TaxID=542300 RepID=UPI0021DF881C|nr:ABC transporter permease [Acidicapsa ligni]